ncbi:MAG: methyltransferase domain-containing protein [Propionibacteriaceae bacterium]|jgi:tRNA/tmRNA/rRNA uracil-C5-methylase (TrmA/RlmC/RlmD family)|nr:methyltransferase domain-containing protein [Propionibacteriaceae bacterium]
MTAVATPPLRVERIAHGGHAVAHDDTGRVVFIRHALPGELVRVRALADSQERYWFADTVEVLEPAAARITPVCPIAERCGGCDFQHVRLEAQRELKTTVVRELLQRAAIAHPEFEVEPVPGDSAGLHWRTRLDYQVAAGAVGFYAYHTRDVVPLPPAGCPLAAIGTPTPAELSEVAALSGERIHTIRTIRVAKGDDAVSVLAAGRLQSGPKKLTQRVAYTEGAAVSQRDYRVDAAGFWQVHPGAAAAFATAVLAGLEPRSGERALDLYCGAGLFSGVLAAKGVQVTGVDSAPTAIQAAKRNVPEAIFECARVEGAHLSSRTDLVVLDPSRQGVKQAVVRAVAELHPRKVAYVACDPAALARDLGYFAGYGYRVATIRAFDAFPMTHHVETIAILTPK